MEGKDIWLKKFKAKKKESCSLAAGLSVSNEGSYQCLNLVENQDFNLWCVDSGAKSHMSGALAEFVEIDRNFKGKVQIANSKDLLK